MNTDATTRRAALAAELEQVTAELKSLGVQNPQVSQDWVATPEDTDRRAADPNVAADRAEGLEERSATLAVLETRFNNLTRALQKIAAGQYGTCEICTEPIEADRLDANPAARTCKAHLNDEASLPLT